MTKNFCDLCGKEVEKPTSKLKIESYEDFTDEVKRTGKIIAYVSFASTTEDDPLGRPDICEKCAMMLVKGLRPRE